MSASSLNFNVIRQALTALVDPDANVELRGLPSKRSRVCRGNDLDGILTAARELAGDASLFFTINPVNPAKLPAGGKTRAAEAQDILRRRWLLVDIDPIKPDRNINAT